jgi:hypothetical protein
MKSSFVMTLFHQVQIIGTKERTRKQNKKIKILKFLKTKLNFFFN